MDDISAKVADKYCRVAVLLGLPKRRKATLKKLLHH